MRTTGDNTRRARPITHGGCCFLPPYVLEQVVDRGDPVSARAARNTLLHDESIRQARAQGLTGPMPTLDEPDAGPTGAKHRVVCDAQEKSLLPGVQVRTEHQDATADIAVNEAFDGLGTTWDFYQQVFSRHSLDNNNLPLLGSVHYGRHYSNAFWDGTQMVFGDGDGRLFARFTSSIDVIAHELAHGVTEQTAGLVYRGQPGALNESMSDVFGSMVRQWVRGETVDQADWLIGKELLTVSVHGVALRSMLQPGSAYDDPVLGKDPQPGHMRNYSNTRSDNGGVHINSGIPNRAFALACLAVGGHSWETVGPVWYDVLTGDISANCDFATFADLTRAAAVTRYGAGSDIANAVADGWEQVGLADAKKGRVQQVPRQSSTSPAVPATPIASRSASSADVDECTDPAADAPAGDVPDLDSQLILRRSGGFAGLTHEKQVRLADLPEPDSVQWVISISRGCWEEWARDDDSKPDGYVYHVQCPSVGLDVTVTERAVTPDAQELLHRTIEEG